MKKLFVLVFLAAGFTTNASAVDWSKVFKKDGKEVAKEVATSPGCWNRSQVTYRAQKLENKAIQFKNLINAVAGYSYFASDVRQLKREARRFNDMADEGALCWLLDEKFQNVKRAFRTVKREFHYAHSIHHIPVVAHKFQQLQNAFRKLKQEVQF